MRQDISLKYLRYLQSVVEDNENLLTIAVDRKSLDVVLKYCENLRKRADFMFKENTRVFIDIKKVLNIP